MSAVQRVSMMRQEITHFVCYGTGYRSGQAGEANLCPKHGEGSKDAITEPDMLQDRDGDPITPCCYSIDYQEAHACSECGHWFTENGMAGDLCIRCCIDTGAEDLW